MSVNDEKSPKIVTEVQFSISGQREKVYKLLEKIRKIIGDANNSDDQIEILINTNTANMGIETEDGKVFEDEATMMRWSELQNSDVDLNAMVLLNKTQNAVTKGDISVDVLKDKINFFTDSFMPNFLDKILIIADNLIGDKLISIQYEMVEEEERTKYQYLKLGKINIVLKQNFSHEIQEIKQIIVKIMEEFFENKGVSRNMAKNIDVEIRLEEEIKE